MKLLFTSDTHHCPDDLRLGALARARGAALVAVAGDLLDVFGKHPGTQIHSAVGWLRALAAEVPHLAVCSGNHDPDGPNGAGWLRRAAVAARAGNLTVDGHHAVLRAAAAAGGNNGEDGEGLVVSGCPYWNIQERGVTHHLWLKDQAQKVWAEGRRLASLHGLPWIVLHHEPPEGAPASPRARGARARTSDRGRSGRRSGPAPTGRIICSMGTSIRRPSWRAGLGPTGCPARPPGPSTPAGGR